MSDVPDNELRQNLDTILNRAQKERIMISRRGKPCAVLVGIESYDGEDLELATSEEFWRMIGERRAVGKSIPLADVEKRLGVTAKKSPPKPTASKRSTKSE
jgi:prevent-host-death family protein